MWRWARLLAVLLAAASCSPGPSSPDGGDGTDAPFDGDYCEGPGLTRCDDRCAFLPADAENCGACGNACPEGGVCVQGSCQCPSGRTDCGGTCVDLQRDPSHCGGCETACDFEELCRQGSCGMWCLGGELPCEGTCVDPLSDAQNCGACGNGCPDQQSCVEGTCQCLPEETTCDGLCTNLQTDPAHCGKCGTQCFGGYDCVGGECACPEGLTSCTAACVDTDNDPNNCGGCDQFCQAGQACVAGHCETPCPQGQLRCGALCVDPQVDTLNCGACGNACVGISCVAGQCTFCDSTTTDCDHDGWTVAEGDCCDTPGSCGAAPERVNPGAFEVLGNQLDDNCNGLVDGADLLDLGDCDQKVSTTPSDPADFGRAMGICRTTTEAPPLPQKGWGLLSAGLYQANGDPLSWTAAASVRPSFGYAIQPVEGSRLVVLSTGIASDGLQSLPGPVTGPRGTSVVQSPTGVDIQNCQQPWCVSDWFMAANPPLKLAQRLPEAPGCAGSGIGINLANDSVMLVLRLRAPTNARAFEFKGYFFSSEYPEFVCSDFNDQLIALIDTPGGVPAGAWNPPDKNLMTYFHQGRSWPIGINMASGTSLFRVCTPPQVLTPICRNPSVSSQSCSFGPADLLGTGFDQAASTSNCTGTGGTGWMVTRGNVRPGEIVTLRIALWDVSDHIRDSLALLDGFKWLEGAAVPGTSD